MTFPTIHMNGTSADSLLEDLCEAMSAIRTAQEKLCHTAPNGRDYYVKPGSLEVAQDEYFSRQRQLAAVLGELDQIAENVSAQNDERIARKRGA